MLNSPKGELSMPLDEIVASMEASCSFMTMTINRAIDFTKASRSIELVPKMETFSLVEAVQAQVRCMNSLRSSPSSPLVVFEGDMEEICSCIISDKQWFMENLLCLLSNAVKYSDDDTRVKIKIQLEKFHPWQGALPVEPGRHSSYETGTPLSQMMVRNSSHPGGRFIGPAGVVGSSNIQPYPEMGARERDRDRDRDSIQEIALRRQSHNPSPAVSLPGSMVKNMSSPPPSSSLNSKSTRQSFILTDMLRITVEDTGIGLSDEAMKKLFRPFKQAQRFSGA
jgi:signal transduction histidine kinase